MALAMALGLLAACGGGGNSPLAVVSNGSDAASATTPAIAAGAPSTTDASTAASAVSVPVTHLSGSIVKGPVTGAQVCVYELLPIGKGKQLACTSSRADGSYALSLEFAGEVVVEAVGGTYTDETTGLTGVPLSAPLTSATKLGGGPSVLHTTPLTALAYNQAMAAGAGGLSLANFETKASLVKDAFGLGADVDLKTTLPNVDVASANAYGNALRAVSKMLGFGATLAGVVGNTNLAQLKRGIEQVAQCGVPVPVQNATVEPVRFVHQLGFIFLHGSSSSSPVGLNIDVQYPDETWRRLLANESKPMGCTVAVNAVESVVMQCPQAALSGHLTILSEQANSADLLSRGLPVNGILVVGKNVTTHGKVNVAGDITLRANSIYVNDSASLASTGGNVTMDTITGNKFPLFVPVTALTEKIYSGCIANVLDTTGSLPGVVSGGGAVNLASVAFDTKRTAGQAVSGGSITLMGAENYGSGITLQNTATINKGTLSITASGH